MSIPIDNPLKWLLATLPLYLEPDSLAELMDGYEANKAAYYHAVKVRDLERKIKFAAHWPPSDERTARVDRWRAKLAKLKADSPNA